MSSKYYPRLSSVVSWEQLPEAFNFVANGASALLDKLYFRNLQVVQSLDGQTVSYFVEIVSFADISFELPGTGFALILNPAPDVSGLSVFPISFSFSWGIRKFIKNFSIANFADSPASFFNLLFDASGIATQELLYLTVGTFIDAPDALDQFAADLNTNYGTSIPLPLDPDAETAVNDIMSAMATAGLDMQSVILSTYIEGSGSISDAFGDINDLFAVVFGGDAVGQIKNMLVPEIGASMELSAGIEIPRYALLPMYDTGGGVFAVEEDPNIKTTLVFDAGAFHFSTSSGIGFNQALTVGFQQPYTQAQIGKTGLTIGFTEAKLDLSRQTNIPEADAAGYPTDFVGVYIQEASIGLPAFWMDNSTTGFGIIGKDLLIGTGGFSGTICLHDSAGVLDTTLGNNGFNIGLTAFDITFRQNAIVESNIRGQMTVPGFKDGAGNPALLEIEMNVDADGNWSLTASEAQGLQVIDRDVFSFYINSLEAGNRNGLFLPCLIGAIGYYRLHWGHCRSIAARNHRNQPLYYLAGWQL